MAAGSSLITFTVKSREQGINVFILVFHVASPFFRRLVSPAQRTFYPQLGFIPHFS